MQSFSFDACISGLDRADIDTDIGVIFLLNIGGSLLTSLFTFFLICIGLYVQKEKC